MRLFQIARSLPNVQTHGPERLFKKIPFLFGSKEFALVRFFLGAQQRWFALDVLLNVTSCRFVFGQLAQSINVGRAAPLLLKFSRGRTRHSFSFTFFSVLAAISEIAFVA